MILIRALVERVLPTLIAVFAIGSCAKPRAPEGVTSGAAANLIVFIGQRITVTSVTRSPSPNVILMDKEFAAHYRVLSVLHGSWSEPEIRFAVFDHYGTPAFSQHETVLLYVSRYDGVLVHQKYLYSPLERTRDGGWASCDSPYLNRPEDEPRRVSPKPVSFVSPVRFPLAGRSAEDIAELFPAPAFAVRGDSAECRMAYSPEDLFRAAREGVLKAREVF